MHILLLGATGNLGRRILPALLAHNHTAVAFVRSKSKLQSLTTPALFDSIAVVEGDALNSPAVESALRDHQCEGIMNLAGNKLTEGGPEVRRQIALAVTEAAVRVGKERGRPLRTWFIGGLGSMLYPGTGGWRIQDYMPLSLTKHLRGTYEVLTAVNTADVEWSLLCVPFMRAKDEVVDILAEPSGNGLIIGVDEPPSWEDSWVRWIPVAGKYLNLVPVIVSYTTRLEEVADLLAEDFGKERSEFVGEVCGMKAVGKTKGI